MRHLNLLIISLLLLLLLIMIIFKNKDNLIEFTGIITNPIFEKTSTIDIQPIYNDSLLETSKILTKNYPIFKEEVLNSYKIYTTIKGDQFFEDIVEKNTDWKKLYIKWHSDIDPLAKKICPKSCKIIESLPDVKIAMFSVLSPGAKIIPHQGPYKGCLRYHLGLSTPNSENCFIVVGKKKKQTSPPLSSGVNEFIMDYSEDLRKCPK